MHYLFTLFEKSIFCGQFRGMTQADLSKECGVQKIKNFLPSPGESSVHPYSCNSPHIWAHLEPLPVVGKQGWHSCESTRLPPMCPGFDSQTRHHMWVEFVVGSLPCSERFFSGHSSFLLSSKTNIYKFQFDLDCRQALYLEPLAQVIVQALPVFVIKFAFTFVTFTMVDIGVFKSWSHERFAAKCWFQYTISVL